MKLSKFQQELLKAAQAWVAKGKLYGISSPSEIKASEIFISLIFRAVDIQELPDDLIERYVRGATYETK